MSRNSAPRHGLSILLLLLLATAGVAFPLAMSGCPGTSDPGVDPGTCLRMPGCETTSSICLGRVGKRVRFLVSGESAAKRVKGWLDSGVHWGEVLSRLQSGGDA